MKKILAILAVSTLSGCFDDDAAPYIEAAATSFCKDINDHQSYNNLAGSLNLVDGAINQLKSEYSDSTDVQDFFRNGAIRVDAYKFTLRQRTIDQCSKNPEKPTNQVLTDELNKLYKESISTLSLGSCKIFNSGNFDNESIISQIKSMPNTNNSASLVRHALSDSRFNESYFDKTVTEYCSKNPYMPMLAAYNAAANQAHLKLVTEQRAAQSLEAKKQREEEEKERQEKHRIDIEKYGVNLFTNGEATCENLKKQKDLSFLSDVDTLPFEKALTETITSIPLPELPHQQSAFQDALQRFPKELAAEIVDNCDTDIPSALLKTRFISKAKSPIIEELELIEQTNSGTTRSAASMALQNVRACEQNGTSEIPCLVSSEQYLQVYTAMLENTDYQSKIDSEKKKLESTPGKFELTSYGYGNACRQQLIDKGIRGDEYDKEDEAQCTPIAIREYHAPTLKNINDLESKISANKSVIDEIINQHKASL
ncbi:TPA: hypothetical protein SLW37_001511 [Pseudomonas aeruginosa]|nr:hypothetical protein [Pseudomonas aeruginosa]HEJ2389135.1 hypothetical protein [Pseudomonas aeruginosa]